MVTVFVLKPSCVMPMVPGGACRAATTTLGAKMPTPRLTAGTFMSDPRLPRDRCVVARQAHGDRIAVDCSPCCLASSLIDEDRNPMMKIDTRHIDDTGSS